MATFTINLAVTIQADSLEEADKKRTDLMERLSTPIFEWDDSCGFGSSGITEEKEV